MTTGEGTSLSGRQVGRYWVEDLLGHGGMGEVYRGYDPTLRRRIVVKRLHPDGPHNVERSRRLEREAQLHGQLSHPNVVRVYDFVSTGDADYLVSELVEGGTLAELAGREPPTVPRALGLLVQIARAMQHSHAQGIIHRDLKLDNVLVTADGTAKVTDFGLSRSSGRVGEEELRDAAASGVVGTFVWMAPEQLWGQVADARSDLFAFGLMAYQLLSGRHPFEGATAEETMRNIMERAPLALRAANASVPIPVSELVDRLLAKKPEGRPGSFAEVLGVFERFLGALELEGDERANVDVRQVAMLHLRLHQADGARADARTLLRFQAVGRALVQSAAGHVVYGADRELVACFGYPEAHERNACAAAELAASLQTRLGASGVLAAGLELGEVSISAGDPAALFAGPALESARDLVDHAGPGRMLTVGHVRGQLIAGGFRVRHVGGDAAGDARFEVEAADAADLQEPLGREEALRGLEVDLRATLTGEAAPGRTVSRAVAVEGEAGIGKTTLVRALLRRADALATQVLPVAIGTGDRYVPFSVARRLLLLVLGGEGRSAADLRAAIEGTARALGDPLLEAAVAQLTGVATEADRERLVAIAGDGQAKQIAGYAVRFLLARIERRPTLIFVEDLHWADSASLAFVDALAAGLDGQPVFLLTTLRPELKLAWGASQGRRTLVLERLGAADGRAILARIEGASAIPPELVESILARADGVPLWLEELAHTIIEQAARGELRGGTQSLPASLRDSVQYRLQLVGARTRRVAELAAAIGGSVPAALLQASAEVTPKELQADLDALEARGLVRRQGLLAKRQLAFRHALMEAAVYADAEAHAAELHGAICRGLETGVAGHAPEQPALFAHHYERAGRRSDAIEWWVVAGRKAAERWAHDVAVANYERALALVAQEDDSEARRSKERDLRSALAMSLMLVHGLGSRAVEQNNAQLHRLSEGATGPMPWFAMYASWAQSYVTSNLQGVTAWTGLIQERADHLSPEEAGDRPGYDYMLVTTRALLHYHVGQLTQAIATFEEAEKLRPAALPFFGLLPDKSQLVLPGTYGGMACALLGDDAAARAWFRREEEAWPEGSVERYTVHTVEAYDFTALRDYDEVRRTAGSVLSAPAGTLNPTHTGFSQVMIAISELHRLVDAARTVDVPGFQEAGTQLVEGLYQFMLATWATGIVIGVLLQQALCAEAALELAEHPKSAEPLKARALEIADAIVARGLQDLERSDVEVMNRFASSEFHRVRARLARAHGDRDGTKAALDRASEILALVEAASGRPAALLVARAEEARARYLGEQA